MKYQSISSGLRWSVYSISILDRPLLIIVAAADAEVTLIMNSGRRSVPLIEGCVPWTEWGLAAEHAGDDLV